MDNQYWVDDDGYIAHGTGDNYVTVSGEIDKEHIQAISLILTLAPELVRALTRIGIEGKREAGNYDKYDARGFVRIAEDALTLLKSQ